VLSSRIEVTTPLSDGRVPPSAIVTARISAVKAGLAICVDDLEPTTWPAATSSGS
jgi:hypothetical protein